MYCWTAMRKNIHCFQEECRKGLKDQFLIHNSLVLFTQMTGLLLFRSLSYFGDFLAPSCMYNYVHYIQNVASVEHLGFRASGFRLERLQFLLTDILLTLTGRKRLEMHRNIMEYQSVRILPLSSEGFFSINRHGHCIAEGILLGGIALFAASSPQGSLYADRRTW